MLRTSPFIGRDRELCVLRRALERGASEGTALTVVGEPGIGKTSLLEVLRAEARSEGTVVLSAVGVEAESRLPFAALQQLLSPVLVDVARLNEPLRLALMTAFGLETGPQPSIFLIAEATLALLKRAGHPRVVIADDVQWLDAQTDEILTYVGRRAKATRVTVIGAARLGHRCLFLDAGFDRLELAGLPDEAGQQILDLAASALSSRDRAGVLAEARGNPLALLELPKVWSPGSTEDHPPLSARLERAFASRIAELPPTTRDVLLTAAVDSSDDLEEILAAASTLGSGRRTPGAVDPAVEAGLVSVEDGRLRFRHPLMLSGVLRSESVIRSQAANGAVADVLTGHHYRQIWHRAHSIVGPDDAVADQLAGTVEESLRRGAVMTAVASLERAAELSSLSATRGHRLLVAAEHAFDSGRADVVHRLVDEAARTDLSDLDWARMQWLREIFEDGVPGDAVRVVELCDMARRSSDAGDSDLALNLLMGAALRCWWADTGPAARAEVVAAVHAVPDRHDPRHIAAIAVADPVEHGAAVAAHLHDTDLASVDDADALRLYGMAAHAIGDSPLATDLLDRAEVLLRERALLGLLPHVLGMQVHIRHELGDWAGARAAMHDVQHLATETGQPIWSLNNRILAAQSEAFSGHWHEALDLLADAEIEADRRGLNDTLCLARLAHGTALLAGDRPTEAYHQLRATFDPANPAFHQRERFSGLGFLAEAAARSGHVEDAAALLPELERVSALTPSPLLRIHLLYARAVLAEDAQVAESHYRAAIEDGHERWPWPRARLLAAYGHWLQQQGRSAEATPLLHDALAAFDQIGATPWAARVRRQLTPQP